MPPPFAPSTAPPSGLPSGLPSTTLTYVLVTAADPAGLVLAVDLARHGVDAVVLGGPPLQAQPQDQAVALDTESQELLDDLGVLDRLIAATPRGRTPAAAVLSAFAPLEVSHGALLDVLHERLVELGGAIHVGHTYVAGESDGARLNCYVDGPAGPVTIRSRYTVRTDAAGADDADVVAAADERVLAIGSAARETGRRLGDAYNLGWKLAAVLRGAPEWIVRTYDTERAASRKASPSLSLSRLSARPDGGDGGVGPGERAPDAPVLSASGRPTRLATLLHGPHWTLLGYGLGPGERAALHLTARPGLHLHVVAECAPEAPDGAGGDLVDIEGEVRWAYGITAGDWVLIRPDGLVSAIVAATEFDRLREHLVAVGL